MNNTSLGKSQGKPIGPTTNRHHKPKSRAHSQHKLGFGVGGMALAEPPGGASSKAEEPREALPTAPNAPRPRAKAGGQFIFPQVSSRRSTTGLQEALPWYSVPTSTNNLPLPHSTCTTIFRAPAQHRERRQDGAGEAGLKTLPMMTRAKKQKTMPTRAAWTGKPASETGGAQRPSSAARHRPASAAVPYQTSQRAHQKHKILGRDPGHSPARVRIPRCVPAPGLCEALNPGRFVGALDSQWGC